MTLLEVLIGASIVALISLAAAATFSHFFRGMATIQSLSAVEQVEDELRVFALGYMRSYVYCGMKKWRSMPSQVCPPYPPTTPQQPSPPPVDPVNNCTTANTSFIDRWNARPPNPLDPNPPPPGILLPSGVVVELITSGGQMPVIAEPAYVQSGYSQARNRCLNSQTLKVEWGTPPGTPDFKQIPEGIYFCLRLKNGPNTRSSKVDLTSMQPVVAEFRFVMFNAVNMKPLSCQKLETTTDPVLGMLYYTLYWRVNAQGKPKYEQLTGSYMSGADGL